MTYEKTYNPHRIVSTASREISDGPHRLLSTAPSLPACACDLVHEFCPVCDAFFHTVRDHQGRVQ